MRGDILDVDRQKIKEALNKTQPLQDSLEKSLTDSLPKEDADEFDNIRKGYRQIIYPLRELYSISYYAKW